MKANFFTPMISTALWHLPHFWVVGSLPPNAPTLFSFSADDLGYGDVRCYCCPDTSGTKRLRSNPACSKRKGRGIYSRVLKICKIFYNN